MLDIKRKIPACADPICRPHPKPTDIHLQVISRKLKNSDINALEQDNNTDFGKKSHYQEGVRNVPKA